VYAAPGLPRPVDLSMRSKTAALYGLPTIVDYEHLASRRFADLYVWMTSGRRAKSALSWIRSTHRVPRERRIFDLLATRWVVTGPTGADLPLALTPRWSDGHYQVLENEQALPRAFFVPEAAVVADPEARLRTLTSLEHDARQLALLESLPADGFLGRPGGRGQATIASSRSEELVVQVEATEEGFLFVSDQHYPGWVATVNGEPAPIVRANHAFRLVRVPAGPSTVAFQYRPWSVRAGAVISLATLAGLVAWGAHRRRSRVS
ncbi:MAG: YfhO family protein, partial [Myxococcota bacterium]